MSFTAEAAGLLTEVCFSSAVAGDIIKAKPKTAAIVKLRIIFRGMVFPYLSNFFEHPISKANFNVYRVKCIGLGYMTC
jgi:hypothetical protein